MSSPPSTSLSKYERDNATVGVEVKHKPGFSCKSKVVAEAIGTFSIRHLIFSFTGPISTHALFFVFWYKYIWLYSWIEMKWYPCFCNGVADVTRNVFVRYSLSILKSDGDDDEEGEGDYNIPPIIPHPFLGQIPPSLPLVPPPTSAIPTPHLPRISTSSPRSLSTVRREEPLDEDIKKREEKSDSKVLSPEGTEDLPPSEIEKYDFRARGLPVEIQERMLADEILWKIDMTLKQTSDKKEKKELLEMKRKELQKVMPIFDERFFDVPRCGLKVMYIAHAMADTSHDGYTKIDKEDGGDGVERRFHSNSVLWESGLPSDLYYDEDRVNVLPNERSIIIDDRRRRREDLWLSSKMEDRHYEVEMDTHFFDCHLFPVDTHKILRKSVPGDGECVRRHAIDAIPDSELPSNPFHSYWLWLETGWQNRHELYHRYMFEEKLLPLDLVLYVRGMFEELDLYRSFMKSRLPVHMWLAQSDFKDTRTHMRDFINQYWEIDLKIPVWYFLQLGVLTIDEVTPHPAYFVSSISDGKYEWAEVFLGRGFVTDVEDVRSTLCNVRAFKLVEKYVGIPYRDIRFASSGKYADSSQVEYSESRAYELHHNKFREELKIHRWPARAVAPSKFQIISMDIVSYLVESGRLEEMLPLPEIDLISGGYTEKSISMRIEYLSNMIARDVSSLFSEEKIAAHYKVQGRCVMEYVRELLIFCDAKQMSIDNEVEWLGSICKYVSSLLTINSKYVEASLKIETTERVREVLKKRAEWSSHGHSSPREILEWFIKDWSGIVIREPAFWDL